MPALRRTMMILLATLALAACAPANVDPGEMTPALADMKLATPAHGKIGVPVDVRYQLSGVVTKDQPSTLQLAFIPRVAGTVMRVEFPASQTVSIETGNSPMSMQKAQAANVYRRSLVVTPRESVGGEIQVIVSMDIEGGRYFSVFTIPLGSGQINQ